MIRWAIYRIHYGLDYLKQSIESIIDDVDHVFVVYSKEPWSKKKKVTYLGEEFDMPELHENVEAFMQLNFGNNLKVHWTNTETTTPLHQFSDYYRMCLQKYSEITVPQYVLLMEPDMIFRKTDVNHFFSEYIYSDISILPCVGFTQIELWKNHNWRIPQRDRIGPMLWKADNLFHAMTHFGTYTNDQKYTFDEFQNYNFGFCMNARTMLYKHLTAINFSTEIGDSIPSHEWYRDKWLQWTPETTDLEIASKWKHLIKRAEPYEMPEEMKLQIGYFD